jgi:DNA polymerase III subunit gamma/tau
MPLYRKYRWEKLEDILGNEDAKTLILNSLEREDRPQTYLFYGPTGVGKTTTARILAKEFGCHKSELREYDIGSIGGVDNARKIKEDSIYPPLFGDVKVYILDECQNASKQFWEASLKLLEEPPPYIYFILCTTDPQKISDTIKGRATKIKFNSISDMDMKLLLSTVLELEGFKEFPAEAIKEIVKIVKGCPREALNILDLVMEVSDDDEMIRIIKSYTIFEEQVIELCRALIKKKSSNEVAKILKGLEKVDEEKIRRTVLSYTYKVLLNKWDQHSANIINEFKDPFFNSGKPGLGLACFACLQ